MAPSADELLSRTGVVAIGRNEGDRLRRCLDAIDRRAAAVVYVDSGSTDGSRELARSRGVRTVEPDPSTPFTAARARNVGLEELLRAAPGVEFVQFVDADCEFFPGWFDTAVRELAERPKAAAVCGRVRERFPDASVYQRLCDLEWDTPVGEADACGGIALMRVAAVRWAGGFRASLIAGEEPELCLRLRRAGWTVHRLHADMVWHDAAMTRFRQWWRRNVRAGHAVAEVSALHRRGPLTIWRREARSNWFWGLLLPAVALAAGPWTWGLSLLLLLGYGWLAWRVYRWRRRRAAARLAALDAAFCTLGKVPQMLGQVRYWRDRWLGRASTIVEYKGQSPSFPPRPVPGARGEGQTPAPPPEPAA
jgi:GT2 family glycosyltransferase